MFYFFRRLTQLFLFKHSNLASTWCQFSCKSASCNFQALVGGWLLHPLNLANSAEEFICDVTSANVPVWAYHETVLESDLPYDMGVESALNLNDASYTIMMWLKQGSNEPADTIIIGQFIDTSTTTTFTSTSMTTITATSTTSSTSQTTTCPGCTALVFCMPRPWNLMEPHGISWNLRILYFLFSWYISFCFLTLFGPLIRMYLQCMHAAPS